MTAGLEASYDDVPYVGAALERTHPGRLAAVGHLFGLQPRAVEACRVLELACGTGGNLIPMAAGLPASEFLGIDLSARQVRLAQVTAASAGVENVRFEHGDILAFPAEAGEFDYVIAYGVYSWAPEPVREAILDVCRRHLAPHGLALISYNTNPGWRFRQAVREMLQFHARFFEGRAGQVAAARDLLAAVAAATTTLANARDLAGGWVSTLESEAKILADRPDFYLAHEHLEESNEGFYLWEFVASAAGHSLRYLADAELAGLAPQGLPASAREILLPVIPPGAPFEQYRDFVTGRSFRQSILCREDAPADPVLDGSRLLACAARTASRWVGPGEPHFDPASWLLRAPSGTTIRISSPVAIAALSELIEAAPAPLPVNALAAAVGARLEAGGESELVEQATPERLGSLLLDLLLTGEMIELTTHVPAIARSAGEFPRATRLARLEAIKGDLVTNLLHATTLLDAVGRFLLAHLDGSNDRETLARLVATGVPPAELEAHVGDEQLSAEAVVERALGRFARQALLLA